MCLFIRWGEGVPNPTEISISWATLFSVCDAALKFRQGRRVPIFFSLSFNRHLRTITCPAESRFIISDELPRAWPWSRIRWHFHPFGAKKKCAKIKTAATGFGRRSPNELFRGYRWCEFNKTGMCSKTLVPGSAGPTKERANDRACAIPVASRFFSCSKRH